MAKSKYEIVKAWRKKNPDKVNEQSARRRKKCPEKFAAASVRYREKNGDRIRPIEAERARNKRKTDPEGNRRRLAKFKARREAERTRIAGRPRPNMCDLCNGNHHLGIVFDHCHSTGKFRGWLCDRCNKTLGIVKDDPKLLRRMADYLENGNVEIDGCGQESPTSQKLCGA